MLYPFEAEGIMPGGAQRRLIVIADFSSANMQPYACARFARLIAASSADRKAERSFVANGGGPEVIGMGGNDGDGSADAGGGDGVS